jgi:alkanesulfonate monooxygenase SsuD/methylene tetrahydromethanopterin reductase-like flavin-dependent oxidoreductase (luciferase family)
MLFNFFHLMPWPHCEEPPTSWPVANKGFDAEKACALYETYTEAMAYSEQCGFDWVGCNEHHFSPYGLMSNCNLIGAALVARTKRIKLGMFGNLVPLLNPVRVAEEYAMLDVMSGGRLIAGFMRGIPHEYRAYNVNPDESHGRLDEAARLIVKCWTSDEPFRWEGEYYNFPSVSIWPRPMQRPHPRLLMSASNAEAAEFAARHKAIMGVTLIADLDLVRKNIEAYKKAARANGYEPTPAHVLTGHQTVIADSDTEAREIMRQGLDYFHQVLMRPQRETQSQVLQQTGYYASADQKRYFDARLKTLRERTLEEQIEAGTVFCGSPESVVKQMTRVQKALGHGVFNMTMKIGNMPDAAVRRGMELFRDRVAPHVRGL